MCAITPILYNGGLYKLICFPIKLQNYVHPICLFGYFAGEINSRREATWTPILNKCNILPNRVQLLNKTTAPQACNLTCVQF